MNDRSEPKLCAKLGSVKHHSIRAWRDDKVSMAERDGVFPETYLRRSLRKERALSGRIGYDINRHIRLVRQHMSIRPKEKTPSLGEGVSNKH